MTVPSDEHRRSEIVRAASILFAREGFRGTSMAMLAKAVGLSKPALYHYFSTKESILAAILLDYALDLAEEVEAIGAKEGTAEARLRALICRLVERYQVEADVHRVQLNDLERLDDAERRAVRDAERRVVRVMERLVAELAPEMDPLELPVAAMSVFGIVNWYPTWFKEADGRLGRAEYGNWVADFVLAGLRSHQGTAHLASGSDGREERS
ncbi:transcriptional regulator, TetR family [Acidimicrobium ferrooxidans DSM 10331]|uniref:Transcriptional regulator, TetR family n=1 Tax=Acidimicrobium ferrooxidans (strain DSM 10331 / JCM 15462 / NBRC 103882 / ICP) TaxID=525909 RepID=C7LZZ0_ACIFD|nr:TetR/AcrR family transcriptional regulator [Acidimicrobium ferrooxidans]ACU54298.1 transcriptional regulator, TetR family [Acidimicrobium ferrooxidans DSM 10331]